MVHFITTHNARGEAVFDSASSEQEHELEIPPGKIRHLYTTHQDTVDLSSSDDVEQYKKDRVMALFDGARRICPDNGSAACVMSLKPGAGAEGGMHRTMTVDVIFVLSGQIELELDSGVKQVLIAGDSVVQRGTMHKWRNVTPNDQWATMLVFIQPTIHPIKAGALSLSDDWKH